MIWEIKESENIEKVSYKIRQDLIAIPYTHHSTLSSELNRRVILQTTLCQSYQHWSNVKCIYISIALFQFLPIVF